MSAGGRLPARIIFTASPAPPWWRAPASR